MKPVAPSGKGAQDSAGNSALAIRLHLHPGTSGLAPHMALIATGAAFDIVPVDLFAGAHRSPKYLNLNPFGTVPILEWGGEIITETGAILLCIAEQFPRAALLPKDSTRIQAVRWLFHAAAIHADFMTWRRSEFQLANDSGAQAVLRGWMERRLESAFRAIETGMVGPFLAGSAPGIAELYLLMVAGWWSKRFDFARQTPRFAACLGAAAQLPYVQPAYTAEGKAIPIFR